MPKLGQYLTIAALTMFLAVVRPRPAETQSCGSCAPPCPEIGEETAMFTIADGGELEAGDCGIYRQHRLAAGPQDLYFDADFTVKHTDAPPDPDVPPYPKQAVTFETTGGLNFRNPLSLDVEFYESDVPSPPLVPLGLFAPEHACLRGLHQLDHRGRPV